MNAFPPTSSIHEKKKPSKKGLIWTGFIILTLSIASYFGALQTQFLGADLIASVTLPGVNTDDIYIPNYSAAPGGETGNLEVRARNDIGTFDAVTFKLEYTPVDALDFSDHPIVIEPTDAFSNTSIALQLADTSVPGELSLIVILDDPIAVPSAGAIDPDVVATHPTLFRLEVDIDETLTAGEVVTMTTSELSVLNGITPLAGINTMRAGNITIEAQDDLRVTAVEATDSTHAVIHFSDYISDIGAAIDYEVLEFGDPLSPVAVSGVSLAADQQSVILTLGAAMDPATEYTVEVSPNVLGNAQGASSSPYNIAVFYGYDNSAGQSDVRISNIESLSNTSLRVTFDSPIDGTTLTPINLDLFRFTDPVLSDLTDRTPLVVTSITAVSNTVYNITTSAQIADMPYYAMLFNVEDTNGDEAVNLAPPIFNGYKPPSISVSSVSPNVLEVNESSQNITLSGSNLNIVNSVRINGQSMTIASQSNSSLTFTLPANFAAGGYSLVLQDQNGGLTNVTGAFVINQPQGVLTVISESSQAIPYYVAPGQNATFWALISDEEDLDDVTSVSINMSSIAGATSVLMQKDNGAQATGTQWYKVTVPLSKFAVTSATPYELPVTVKKGVETFYGTVSIMVSNNVYQSEAPIINQAHVSPSQVPPDNSTPVILSAQVSDTDGITGMTVTADLGTIGAGFVPLLPISEAPEGQELTTMFYQSEAITIPTSVAIGNYNISFIATDSTGEITTLNRTLNVSNVLTGVLINEELSYLSRNSVPRGSAIPFSVYAFATHPNGVGNIVSVTADFGTMGIAPANLQKDSSANAGNGTWFLSEEIFVPETAFLGNHTITLVATDNNGSTSVAELEIEVSSKDMLGNAAVIDTDSFYTTPSVLPNDGQTTGTLYAFVKKADENTSVVINLSTIGYLSEAGMAKAGNQEGCGTSNTIVCMTPGVQEGSDGKWFILDGVIVDPSTTPSTKPYLLKATVIKNTGQTTNTTVPVYVNDGNEILANNEPPRLLVGITTDKNTVLAVFSEGMDVSTLSKNNFTITASNNITDQLNISSHTINAAGNIVTLTTETQITGKLYTMTVEGVKDSSGVTIVPGAGNRVPVVGFGYSGKKPQIEFIDALTSTIVEIELNTPIDPRSITLGQALNASQSYAFDVKIKEEESGVELKVLGLTMTDPRTLEVRTGGQIADKRYVLTISSKLRAYDGTAPEGILSGLFKGFKGLPGLTTGGSGCPLPADIICDGIVDFNDFSVFSYYYGSTYSTSGKIEISDEQLESNKQSIEQPNVPTGGMPFNENGPLVPTNSVPAGGEIINQE